MSTETMIYGIDPFVDYPKTYSDTSTQTMIYGIDPFAGWPIVPQNSPGGEEGS